MTPSASVQRGERLRHAGIHLAVPRDRLLARGERHHEPVEHGRQSLVVAVQHG